MMEPSADVHYAQVSTIAEFVDAIRIRVDVFILEQQCPAGWEPDELDRESSHYVAVQDGRIVATVRLREDPAGVAKIERMAVRREHRSKGIGLGLTQHVISEARGKGFEKIWMEAQTHAQSLYERAGFVVTSDVYDQFSLGIPHVEMTLSTSATDDPRAQPLSEA